MAEELSFAEQLESDPKVRARLITHHEARLLLLGHEEYVIAPTDSPTHNWARRMTLVDLLVHVNDDPQFKLHYYSTTLSGYRAALHKLYHASDAELGFNNGNDDVQPEG